jgi:hypothetical protein
MTDRMGTTGHQDLELRLARNRIPGELNVSQVGSPPAVAQISCRAMTDHVNPAQMFMASMNLKGFV